MLNLKIKFVLQNHELPGAVLKDASAAQTQEKRGKQLNPRPSSFPRRLGKPLRLPSPRPGPRAALLSREDPVRPAARAPTKCWPSHLCYAGGAGISRAPKHVRVTLICHPLLPRVPEPRAAPHLRRCPQTHLTVSTFCAGPPPGRVFVPTAI